VSRQKQKRRQYTEEFKRQALERMKVSDDIVQLAKELGVGRPLLYQWEAISEGRGRAAKRKSARPAKLEAGPSECEAALREEVDWLRAALAKKVKEVDFFRGALQKVEDRRRNSDERGGTGSTTKSGQ
jgi:transposase-like protein